jgi:hypothetical protein
MAPPAPFGTFQKLVVQPLSPDGSVERLEVKPPSPHGSFYKFEVQPSSHDNQSLTSSDTEGHHMVGTIHLSLRKDPGAKRAKGQDLNVRIIQVMDLGLSQGALPLCSGVI